MPFFSLPTGGASPVLVTNGPPTGALGNVGDIAIDTATAVLYGPKTISGWPSGIDLSQGPTGAASTVTGPTGNTGPTGATGSYAFAATGPTAPTGAAITLAGAVWLDASSGRYYVRYDSNWVEVGVQGERGPTGSTGAASTVTGPTGSTGPASTVTGPTGAASTVTGPTGPASTVTGPTGAFPFAATGPTAPALTAAGSVWLDSTTGRYYVRFGDQFIEIGVQGERGPTGGLGPTGPEGGPTGPEGPTGPSGGPTGPTGSIGDFSLPMTVTTQTADYTAQLADAGALVLMSSSSPLTFTIPSSSNVAFPTGTTLDVARMGTGGVTVAGELGVTVRASIGTSLRARYSTACAVLVGADEWLLLGDLA